jgi:hypothetical protein
MIEHSIKSQDSGDSAGDEHLQRTLVATGNGVDINMEKCWQSLL